jgi:hypothetical protein
VSNYLNAIFQFLEEIKTAVFELQHQFSSLRISQDLEIAAQR